MECPFCGEPVDSDAEQCKSCGERLVEDEAKQPGSNSSARTVVFVLLGFMVLGVLACLGFSFAAGVAGYNAQRRLMTERAKAEMHAFAAACAVYKQDTGVYPQQLSDLRNDPGVAHWRGPYLNMPVLADPWGNPYAYSLQNGKPVLISYGKDGAPGGSGAAADIQVGP